MCRQAIQAPISRLLSLLNHSSLAVSKVPNVPNVANVPNVTKQDCTRETKGTLEPSETIETQKTTGNDEVDGEGDLVLGKIDRPASGQRHVCVSCSQYFDIPLVLHGRGGYICEPCRRDGAPKAPQLTDPQTKLEVGA